MERMFTVGSYVYKRLSCTLVEEMCEVLQSYSRERERVSTTSTVTGNLEFITPR